LVPERTTLYLVRHAHAEWSQDDNRSLSPAGIVDAGVVADQLAVWPIAAIYTSPSRRSIETIDPLARRLELQPTVVPDLRERHLPVVLPDQFKALVRRAWSFPAEAPGGGESNVQAQTRGLAVVRTVVRRHAGAHAVLATHGNLLALVLNALDATFGYAFWQRLSFPDIYLVVFDGTELRYVQRLWNTALLTRKANGPTSAKDREA
jgi:2,3-bisphosphoglycerate-dependent phosphoglycerate mutase